MNKLAISLIVVCSLLFVCLCGSVTYLLVSLNMSNMEIKQLQSKVEDLQNDLIVNNTIISQYEKQINLKPFNNEKQLSDWLDTKNYMNNDTTSSSCLELMMEAKKDGYWMGIMPFIPQDNLLSKFLGFKPNEYYILCVTIVGDKEVYVIDATTGYYEYIVEMNTNYSDIMEVKYELR